MAKVSNKTKKIRFYRSRIRKLTGKKYKTKKATSHKKKQLYYLRSRLKTLTARNQTRHTHARTHTRARHPPQNEVELDVRDRFISPRVVSIASSSGVQPVASYVPPVESKPVDISPITNTSENMISHLTPKTPNPTLEISPLINSAKSQI